MRGKLASVAKGVADDVASSVGGAKGGFMLVLLFICFFLIFWQNTLPLDSFLVDDGLKGGHEAYTANTVDRLTRIFMILISVCVIASRWPLARSFGKAFNPGFAAFMVLAPLSALWSIDRSATLLRFTSFACVVLVCVAVSLSGWHRQRLQQIAIPPTVCILVLSLIFGIMYPDKIIEIGDDVSQKNAWHGIVFSKNAFGMLSSAGVILCANRVLAWEKRTFWYFSGAVIAFVCLLLSRSSTSLLATVLAVFFMTMAMRVPVVKRRYSTKLVIGITVTLLIYELVVQNVIPGTNLLLAPIAGLAGKDTTFSARTMIWFLIKDHIHQAPILGTGYGAYWTGPFPSSPSFIFMWRMFFYPTESHNGYLEVTNDLGVVGLATLLAFLYWFVRQGLELLRFDRTQACLYLALLFQAMVINMSESDWFSRSSNFTILTLATACLARALLEHRARVPSVAGAEAQAAGRRAKTIPA